MANPTERAKIVTAMVRYGMTPEMCADKSNNMLLGIAAMTTAHRRANSKMDPDEIIRLGELEKLVAESTKLN